MAIRAAESELEARLANKTLTQAATEALAQAFGCSPFESRAIVATLEELYASVWRSPTHVQPGQMVVLAIADGEPPGKPLRECELKPILITVHSPEDDVLRAKVSGRAAIPAIRQAQLQRIAAEALAQGAYLTVEDVALRILNCGTRTIEADLQYLRQQGITVPLRGQQADIGRGVSHKVQVIRLALQRRLPSEIAQRLHHSVEAVERYLTDFTAVATLLAAGWSVETISFVRRLSLSLVREYAALYQAAQTSDQRTALADLLRDWAPEEKGGLGEAPR